MVEDHLQLYTVPPVGTAASVVVHDSTVCL